MIKKLLLTLIITISVTQLYSQTIYFVAPSASGGSNSNAGTIAAP